jgi:sugar/nucleoside kinase (ribokinase family)
MTLGAEGAMALEGDRIHQVPGCPVPVRDSTGAGDIFRGAFIFGVLKGWDIRRTLRFCNAAAAVSCQRLGALAGVPTRDDIERLLRQTAARS